MAEQSGVSSCVLSIISSFVSGLDVFKRFRELRTSRRGRAKKKSLAADEDEQGLVASLTRGPEDIGREYQRSVSAVGDRVLRRDAVANTALAEVLLKLNIGLVTVINAFLARDGRETELDYRSLTALSDASRVETCRVLRQLYRRLVAHPSKVARDIGSTDHAGRSWPKSPARRSKQRGPVLARVVIAESSKPSQVAMVRPRGRGKHKRSNTQSSVTSPETRSTTSVGTRKTTPLPAYREHVLSAKPLHEKKRDEMLVARSSRASLPKCSRRDLRASVSPLVLPKTELSNAAITQPRRLNKPTPTYCSEASEMTKLGEIPLHKWAEPVDFDAMSRLNKEAARNGWPFAEMSDPSPKKHRRGMFSLFRRRTGDVRG